MPIASFRWARHTGLVPAPDASSYQWSRATVEAIDAAAIQASLPHEPISAAATADRIARALDTPNMPDEPPVVSAFAVRRLITCGLLTGLTANPEAVLINPDQVAAVCGIKGLAQRLAAEAPLGPDQAAARLGVRRVDFDYMRDLMWVRPTERRQVRFGTSRAGSVMNGPRCSPRRPSTRTLRSTGSSCTTSERAGAPRSPCEGQAAGEGGRRGVSARHSCG